MSTHFFRGAGLGSVLVRLGILEQVLALGPPPLAHQLDFDGQDVEPSVNEMQKILASLDMGCPCGGWCSINCSSTGLEPYRGSRSLRERRPERSSGMAIESPGLSSNTPVRLARSVRGWLSGLTGVGPPSRDGSTLPLSGVRQRLGRCITATSGASVSCVHRSMPWCSRSSVTSWRTYFPSDSALACVAVSINLGAFAGFRGAADENFDRRIASHVGIAERYAASTKEGRLLGSGPVDALIRSAYGHGWALVGDAAMSQDPWSGLGMDNAGIHATFLADAISEWLSGRSDEATAFAAYRERRDEHALAGFDFTANLGRDLRGLLAD